MERIRVAIFSDDPLTRSGLAALVAASDGLAVSGTFALHEVEGASVAGDVALVDLAAPEGSERGGPAPPAPFVALVPGPPQAAEALAAGARGVLLRDASADRIAGALVAAHRGLVALDPSLARSLRLQPVDADVESGLTPREREVLGLLAEGLSNKGIAQRLGVAERTAKFHVESILGKLGAETRSEAIVLAARRGLVVL